MNGGRCSTTRIWRPPSSTASWSADGSFASMDPRDELVISSWRTPCQAVPNGSEYLEYVAQNFRNPHLLFLVLFRGALCSLFRCAQGSAGLSDRDIAWLARFRRQRRVYPA